MMGIFPSRTYLTPEARKRQPGISRKEGIGRTYL